MGKGSERETGVLPSENSSHFFQDLVDEGGG